MLPNLSKTVPFIISNSPSIHTEAHTRQISFDYTHNYITYLHTHCKPQEVVLLLLLLLMHARPWHIPLGKPPLQFKANIFLSRN
jgi:hypothetical protein